ncbi:MAG: hypothetical protein ACOC4E_00525 [Patescibacteria group bacterium]
MRHFTKQLLYRTGLVKTDQQAENLTTGLFVVVITLAALYIGSTLILGRNDIPEEAYYDPSEDTVDDAAEFMQ